MAIGRLANHRNVAAANLWVAKRSRKTTIDECMKIIGFTEMECKNRSTRSCVRTQILKLAFEISNIQFRTVDEIYFDTEGRHVLISDASAESRGMTDEEHKLDRAAERWFESFGLVGIEALLIMKGFTKQKGSVRLNGAKVNALSDLAFDDNYQLIYKPSVVSPTTDKSFSGNSKSFRTKKVSLRQRGKLSSRWNRTPKQKQSDLKSCQENKIMKGQVFATITAKVAENKKRKDMGFSHTSTQAIIAAEEKRYDSYGFKFPLSTVNQYVREGQIGVAPAKRGRKTKSMSS
eukprot:CAMPEP_0116014110 /NCGR_PEP_ID=MMETSP0321-20121206/6098_1 /TAXON_ID=163516 /ORGANISM="Leptocylindrus danicus var. danicus, Strain B650" /LENGTH=289 /DNA_ID=CAMNT_0003483731 /DNA_START=334 /DNA_END=1203 /DNA_ORIENTATION=+